MENYIRQLHPWAAAAYMIVTLVLIMTAPYDRLMVLLFALLSVNAVCMFGAGRYVRSLKFYIGMILFLAVFNVVFNSRGETPFLYINDRPFTTESLWYGVYMGFMVSAMFLWFQIFQDVFDNRKITYLIGSRLPVTGLVLSMVFCYYGKFMKKLDKIKEVWNTYAAEVLNHPLKKAGILLSVLLSVMLEDSVDTALSMTARGYGTGKRSRYRTYPVCGMDILLWIAAAAMLVLWILQPFPMELCLIVFVLLPVIYNIYKELQWKFYQSRI